MWFALVGVLGLEVAVLLLIAVALFLFTRDRLPLETSSLTILIILVAGFQFFPYESDGVSLGPAQFFAGFGNEALIAICALMMVGKALETTGAPQPLATIVSQTWTTRPLLAFLLTLVAVAVLSAFINDTPIVVIMIPILVSIALRAKFPVSGVMLPMGFATIIGGMATPIGTSTRCCGHSNGSLHASGTIELRKLCQQLEIKLPPD